jgi:flagellar M-ring protein FliF
MAGPGRVSAQVSVDMDFNQTEEARETYGPQAGMVRSEQTSESGTATPAGGNNANAQGVPGSASNGANTAAATAANAKPANGAAPAQANANANANANAATGNDGTVLTGPTSRSAVRNYELDRTLTHTRNAPGRIRRVTAAVLVDNVPAGAPNKDGKVKTRPLTASETKRIETLVQQAIGFDAQRGDVVSVVNQPFARDLGDAADDAPPVWQNPHARDLLRTLLGGLAVLLVVWFVLRPAFRQLLQPRAAQPLQAELIDDEDVPVAISGPARGQTATQAMNLDDKLQVARNAVSTDAKRVAAVVRDWVGEDA